MLIKKEHNGELTKDFIDFLLDMWSRVEPFGTKEEQQRCELKVSTPEHLKKFEDLDNYGEYSVEFIAKILELIMIQEKTGCARAHMFRGVLSAIRNDKDIFSIVSQAGFSGR